MAEQKPTAIKDIQASAAPQVMELTGWDDKPFHARLKRLSMLEMAEAGEIPNELLGAVTELYSKGMQGLKGIKDTARVFKLFAQKSLMEPSFEELSEADIQLTDQQMLEIYLYSISGVAGLKPFR
jgi:hypothetical protein